ncbi:Hsp20/alpha crystallin family protein [Halogranum amylolyticum]|uniref:Hsp20/alpha crystallin family protein n=1 Tax=Halogranum amylolyticum TaxID=660520 RepID=A0A1H8N1W3_9EURY|nr:Hsp20 family protein [Halogranum amylolyticum]SEO23615.1 Hsp20/alpha crystallin family protein [Halogranum amylolyticum]
MATTDESGDASLDDLPTTPGSDGSLPVDVERFGDEYVVSALLPGLRTQDIDVSVHGRRIRIAASVPDRKRRFLPTRRREVSRVVRLPDPIDHRSVEASYHDGLLRVTAATWEE